MIKTTEYKQAQELAWADLKEIYEDLNQKGVEDFVNLIIDEDYQTRWLVQNDKWREFCGITLALVDLREREDGSIKDFSYEIHARCSVTAGESCIIGTYERRINGFYFCLELDSELTDKIYEAGARTYRMQEYLLTKN